MHLLSEVGRHTLSQFAGSVVEKLSAVKKKVAARTPKAPTDTLPVLPPLAPLASLDEQAMAEAVVQHLMQQVPQAIAIAVNDATTCLPVAFTGPEEAEVSPIAMAVQIGRIARRTTEMALAVAGAEETVQELMLTAGDIMHLVSTTVGGRWQLYLAVNPQETNLALARTLLEQAATALTAAHSAYSAA